MAYDTKTSGATITYKGGYTRDSSQGKPRYDLIPIPELRRVADLYARGAVLYGDRNWELVNDERGHRRFKESALRHMMQWASGETDEDHMAAAVWNLFAYEHTKKQVKPEALTTEDFGIASFEHTCFDIYDEAECLACGVRDCPSGEPLHYHHDGCPVCTITPFLERTAVDEGKISGHVVNERRLFLSDLIEDEEFSSTEPKVGMYEQLLAIQDYPDEAMIPEESEDVSTDEWHSTLQELYKGISANLATMITSAEYGSYKDPGCSDMWSMRAQLVAMELYPGDTLDLSECEDPRCCKHGTETYLESEQCPTSSCRFYCKGVLRELV